jgi:hypothetical protein
MGEVRKRLLRFRFGLQRVGELDRVWNTSENQTLTASEASGAAFPAGSAFVSNSVCSAEYFGLGVDEGCSDCEGLTESGSL